MNHIEPNSNNLPAEESIKSSYGLVAFFDILGYRQIIANNEIKDAALIIRQVLKQVAELEGISEELKKKSNPYSAIEFLTFSDSILVYANYSGDAEFKKNLVTTFAAACVSLSSLLFTEGLPARGAIAIGEFFIEKTSFAGKPIVEAYELSNIIEMCGCVITPTAESEFIGIDHPLFHLFSYPVPLKGNQKQNLYTLSFPFLPSDMEGIRPFTIKQFSQHKKIISPDVIGKVNNTIEFLKASKAEFKKKTENDPTNKYIKELQK